MKTLLTRAAVLFALAMLLPAVWHGIKPAQHQQLAVIQPLPLPTDSDANPWHSMSDAELVRGDAEAY